VGAAHCIVNRGVKDWKAESEKRLDLPCSVALSFIGTTSDSVMIHFYRKRCLSVLTTRVVWTWDRGTEKIGSLKYFEVCGVLYKEPWIDG
jgi:hypothetical protein